MLVAGFGIVIKGGECRVEEGREGGSMTRYGKLEKCLVCVLKLSFGN